MPFLLILSAMLSALTGAFGVARAPVAVQATSLAAAAEARTSVAPRHVAAIVLAQPVPVAAAVIAGETFALAAVAPLYAARRRE